MKIYICCPGSWNNGLNSPERGEGRWAQNYARMLAYAGHEVVAGSGASWKTPMLDEGVTLVNELYAKEHGKFDIYIDPAMWNGKEPIVESDKTITVNWSLEQHYKPRLPEGMFQAYPYPASDEYVANKRKAEGKPAKVESGSGGIGAFLHPDNENIDKTFALPTFFAHEFARSKFSLEADQVFTSARSVEDIGLIGKHTRSVLDYLDHNKLQLIGVAGDDLIANFSKYDNECLAKAWFQNNLPYNKVWDLIRSCKVNIPLIGQSCTLDATFCGVPTLMWEAGGFFTAIAKKHNFLIEREESTTNIYKKLDTLLHDEEKYDNYLYDLQDYLSCHLYHNAIEYFNKAVEVMYS